MILQALGASVISWVQQICLLQTGAGQDNYRRQRLTLSSGSYAYKKGHDQQIDRKFEDSERRKKNPKAIFQQVYIYIYICMHTYVLYFSAVHHPMMCCSP